MDGKYARSQAEAEEREKLKQVKKTKKTLEKFKHREMQVIQAFSGLLGPVVKNNDNAVKEEVEETKQQQHEGKIIRITRDIVDAGKRVVSICDTSGTSMNNDTIVLTQDLSHLESKMAPNAMAQPKSFKDDAENDVVEPAPSDEEKYRKILGLIKLFIANVHNCTIILKCKLITGTVELHNCSNIKLQIESTATVATIQADLSSDIIIEYRDAPSGKNVPTPAKPITLYWGEDKDDRIFHAGITNMKVVIYRDDYVENEIICDYVKDGAETIGNATAEEFQFVTSCIDGRLVTEKVVRSNASTGKNSRAMTERELQVEKERRERAAKVAIKMADDMIQIKDKDGNILVKKEETVTAETTTDDDVIEEVYASMSHDQIQQIIRECDELKQRGNEAFGAGEYGQAILHYTLGLDKASELPDHHDANDTATTKSLFPRDIFLSNRSACFLKLGRHEKAVDDATMALKYNPDNLKANFRLGLALHAQNKYQEALPLLVKALKMEPNNKQIKQALQFCEVRLEQERRKLMEK